MHKLGLLYLHQVVSTLGIATEELKRYKSPGIIDQIPTEMIQARDNILQ
jgi:hypothetical protein